MRQRTQNITSWFTARTRAVQLALAGGTLVLVCACCVIGVAALGSGNTSSHQPTSANGIQATHGPTATARPPTATPKPKAWTTVQTFRGNGISKTAPFTVRADQWKILWSCNPAAYGSEYNLIADLTVPGADFGDSVVNVICTAGDASTTSGETMEYTSGTYYLDVNSEASWTFQIQVME